ncbi:MAG TPA: hypothetical protein VGO67_08245 [Verrucomicrobiae bacterium]|jgi:hypothetical protein
MAHFRILFNDGERTTVEAEVYEEHDGEYYFRRGEEIIAQYTAQNVRGIEKLTGVVQTRGGGSY